MPRTKSHDSAVFDRFVPASTMVFSADGRYSLDFPDDFRFLIKLYEIPASYALTPNYHDFYEICYIHEGTGDFRIGDRLFQFNEGDLFFLGGGDFHLLEGKGCPRLRLITTYFYPDLIYHPGYNNTDFEYLIPFSGPVPAPGNRLAGSDGRQTQYLDLVSRMYREYRERRPFYRLAVTNILREILLLINRQVRRGAAGRMGDNPRMRDLERLKPVLEHIRARFREKLAVPALARIACMSPNYFCRFFRSVTGQTVVDYVTRFRVDRAKELLLADTLNIGEIVYECGFQSHAYFDRIFRRLTKHTPLEFRAQYLKT